MNQDHVVHNQAARLSVNQDTSTTTAATNSNLHAMHAKPIEQRECSLCLEFWKNLWGKKIRECSKKADESYMSVKKSQPNMNHE